MCFFDRQNGRPKQPQNNLLSQWPFAACPTSSRFAGVATVVTAETGIFPMESFVPKCPGPATVSPGAWGRLVAVECPGFPGLEGGRRGPGLQILPRLPESVRWRGERERVSPSGVRTCASRTSIFIGGCVLPELSRAAGAHAWRRKDASLRDVFWTTALLTVCAPNECFSGRWQNHETASVRVPRRHKEKAGQEARLES